MGLRLADICLLVVDCLEGVTFYVERLVREAMRQRMPIVVVLNKLDRLVLELKLPPSDAYFKIKYTVDELNLLIKSNQALNQEQKYLSPLAGNVVFGSTLFASCFTLHSFAQRYLQ